MLTFILSCKQKDEFISVSGRVMSSIDSTLPFSNTSFKFYNSGGPNGLGKSWNYTHPFVTDTLGNVDATINLKEFGGGFAICWPNGSMDEYIHIVKLEPNQKSVDFGTIYTKP